VPVVADLFNTADDDFFHRVKTNSDHVYQPYLPDQTNIPYQPRNRSHNITLINKTKFLNDTDFIIRMLYKYSYWHNIYNSSICMIISLLLHPAAVLLSSNVLVFAILETFIVLSVSLLLCMYII